jgi:hypothetical protein
MQDKFFSFYPGRLSEPPHSLDPMRHIAIFNPTNEETAAGKRHYLPPTPSCTI